jgi:hypothetical protein
MEDYLTDYSPYRRQAVDEVVSVVRPSKEAPLARAAPSLLDESQVPHTIAKSVEVAVIKTATVVADGASKVKREITRNVEKMEYWPVGQKLALVGILVSTVVVTSYIRSWRSVALTRRWLGRRLAGLRRFPERF